MRKRRTFARGGVLLVGFVVLVLSVGAGMVLAGGSPIGSGKTAANSAGDTGPALQKAGDVWVGHSYHNDSTVSLRRMPALPMGPTKEHTEANPNPALNIKHRDQQDRSVQRSLAAPNMPSAILNFDGIPFPGVNCNCAPPDTNGEVGLSQYVQIVNTGFQVFDKSTGSSVFGPVAITTLWQGFGGVCETSGFGDPVALYDQLANRWVITQFAGTSIPTDECVAVSQGTDAAGSYFRYAFHLGSNFFDYPKLGVWPDAYYMSMNVFNSSGTAFLGPQAFALDRTQMLAGNPATFIATAMGAPTDDGYMPADLDGSIPPPAGAPNPFLSVGLNSTWPLHRFHVDFTTPGNSTFNLGGTLTPDPFSAICGGGGACVPQLGVGDVLDTLGDRGMFRSAYRHFSDGHEALVGNMTVASGGVAGIRWFEVNNATSGTPGFVQQSTYQPDSTWRWMGSAAMDGNGDLALGFSASSATINPQIRYAGRLASDPANTLAQGEAHLFDGTGSQTDTVSRWGDYSDMTVDPVDDCTFWYTQEYYQVTSSFNWRTRIGNFKFPSCTSAPSGTLAGTVTDSSTNAPLSGAQINVAPLGASTVTDATGHYSLTLPVGSYNVTASQFGYTPQTQPASITDGNTTTLDFALVAAPSGSLSGTVSDSSANPIANATVTINGTPIPPATTDASGHYSFASVPNGTYNVTATAGNCTSPATDSVTVSGNTTHDFTLAARHDAFGYFCRVETPSYTEGDTPLALSGDDSFTSVSLPFAFSLYGQSYSTANVCTNGYITFLAGNCIFSNSSIPSTVTPNAGIYPYWDDLIIDGSSSMWTKHRVESEPVHDRVAERDLLRRLVSAGRLRGHALRERADPHQLPQHRRRRTRAGQLGHARDRERERHGCAPVLVQRGRDREPQLRDPLPAAAVRLRAGPRNGRERPRRARRSHGEGAPGRQRRAADLDGRHRLLPDPAAGRGLHDRSEQDELRDRDGLGDDRRGRHGDEGLRAPDTTRSREPDVTRVHRPGRPDPDQDAHAEQHRRAADDVGRQGVRRRRCVAVQVEPHEEAGLRPELTDDAGPVRRQGTGRAEAGRTG